VLRVLLKRWSGNGSPGFSLDRLVRFLVPLGNDVEIVVKPRTRSTGGGRVMVA
jgi:hypothetical protein